MVSMEQADTTTVIDRRNHIQTWPLNLYGVAAIFVSLSADLFEQEQQKNSFLLLDRRG